MIKRSIETNGSLLSSTTSFYPKAKYSLAAAQKLRIHFSFIHPRKIQVFSSNVWAHYPHMGTVITGAE